MRGERRHGGSQGEDAGRDRNGNGEDVVDEQRRGATRLGKSRDCLSRRRMPRRSFRRPGRSGRSESTTIASTAAMASETGRTRWADPSDAAMRTASAASVAYATEESGSEAKIGRARVFDSSVSWMSPVARGGPTTTLFRESRRSRRSAKGGVCASSAFVSINVVACCPCPLKLATRRRARRPRPGISRRS